MTRTTSPFRMLRLGVFKCGDALVHADDLDMRRMEFLEQVGVRTVEAHHDRRQHGHVVPQGPEIPLYDFHGATDEGQAVKLGAHRKDVRGQRRKISTQHGGVGLERGHVRPDRRGV